MKGKKFLGNMECSFFLWTLPSLRMEGQNDCTFLSEATRVHPSLFLLLPKFQVYSFCFLVVSTSSLSGQISLLSFGIGVFFGCLLFGFGFVLVVFVFVLFCLVLRANTLFLSLPSMLCFCTLGWANPFRACKFGGFGVPLSPSAN